jgi:hypothetical protein
MSTITKKLVKVVQLLGLTPVAFGIIPLLEQHIIMDSIPLTLTKIPYIASRDILYFFSSFYWTSLLLIIWIISGYYLISIKRNRKSIQ